MGKLKNTKPTKTIFLETRKDEQGNPLEVKISLISLANANVLTDVIRKLDKESQELAKLELEGGPEFETKWKKLQNDIAKVIVQYTDLDEDDVLSPDYGLGFEEIGFIMGKIRTIAPSTDPKA